MFVSTIPAARALPPNYVMQEYPVYVSASPLKFDSASNPWFISGNAFKKFSVASGAIAASYPAPVGTLGDDPTFSLDSSNNIWYAVTGSGAWLTIVKYNYQTSETTRYDYNPSPSLLASNVDNLFLDGSGRVWVVSHHIDSSAQFYVTVFDPSSLAFTTYTAPQLVSQNQLNPSGHIPMTQDSSYNIWLPAPGSSVYKVDNSGGFTLCTLITNSQLYPNSISVDSSGTAWVSITNTLFDSSKTSIQRLIAPGPSANTGINMGDVNYVLATGEYLWVAPGDTELYAYDTTGTTLVNTVSFTVSLTYLGQAPDGSVWVYGQASSQPGQPPTYLFYRIRKLSASELFTTATPSGTVGSSGWYRSAVTVSFSVSGGTAQSIHYTLDGVAHTINGGTGSITISTEGIHDLSYYAVPSSGPAESPKSLEIKIDMTAPRITLVTPTNGQTINKPESVTTTWTVSDNLDANPTVVADPPVIDDSTPDGPLTVKVTATDAAGNIGVATASVLVLSNTPPVSTVAFSGNTGSGDWFTGSVDVTIFAVEGYVTKISYSIDGGKLTTVSSSQATFTVSTQGIHTIQYYATSGNGKVEAPQTATLKMDWTAPTITITSPFQNQVFIPTSQINLQYTVSDNVDTSPSVVVSPAQFPSPLPLGNLQITVTATDAAGNAATATVTVKVQATAEQTASGYKRDAKSLLLSSKTGIHDLDEDIDKVVELIDKSLTPRYWVDESHLQDEHGIKVFEYERHACEELENHVKEYQKSVDKPKPTDAAKLAAMKRLIPVFESAATMLARADAALAKTAMDEAGALTPPTKGNDYQEHMKKAQKEYAEGLADLTAGRQTDSINEFKESWVASRQAAHAVKGDSKWDAGAFVDDFAAYFWNYGGSNGNGCGKDVWWAHGHF